MILKILTDRNNHKEEVEQLRQEWLGDLLLYLGAEIDYIDDEAVVEEVARRVAARLMRESRSQKKARQLEALAEKIANKLNR